MTDVVVVFPFRLLFTLLPSKQPKKWKFQKTEKKHLEISFYRSAPKIMIIICYTFREIWCMMDVIVIFHFGLPSLYTCVPKIMIRWCTVPEIWCATGGWTDRHTGRRKSHIQRWVPHLTKNWVGHFLLKWYKNGFPVNSLTNWKHAEYCFGQQSLKIIKFYSDN